MSTTTQKVHPRELQAGDVLASGSVILGYDRIVTGGYVYKVRQADGQVIRTKFDGRRKVTVTR